MDNIDDFMRQKFDSDKPAERFQFHEEYWEQAQALIEADEAKRRKRRRWLFWWFFVGLGLLCVAWCAWPDTHHKLRPFGQAHESGTGRNAPENQTGDMTQTYSANDTIDNQLVGEKSTLEPADRTSGQIASKDESVKDQDPEGLNEKASSGISSPDPKEHKLQGPKLFQNRSKPPANDQKHTRKDRPDKRESGGQITGRNAVNAGVSQPERDNKSIDNEAITDAKTLREANKNRNDKVSLNDLTSPANASAIEPKQNNLSINGGVNEVPTTFEDSLQGLRTQFLELFNLFEPLPLPFKPVAHDTKIKNPVKTSNNADQVNKIDVRKDKRLKWSADLAASYFTGIGEASPWGANAGFAANYRLNPIWAVSLGAGCRYVPDQRLVNQNDTTESTTLLRYRFGYEKEAYTLESNALYMLEFPVVLHWSKRALGLEAGIAPGFLLGVSGKVVRESNSSLHQTVERSVVQKRVSIDDAIYRKTFFSLFAGAEWKATRHLGLVTKIAYRPSGVLKNYTDVTGPKSELFWIDAGFRIRF